MLAVDGVDSVQKWLLPTLSEILAQSILTGADIEDVPTVEQTAVNDNAKRHHSRRVKAEREWVSARRALEELLLAQTQHDQGIITQDRVLLLDTPENTLAERGQGQLLGLVLAGPVPVLSHHYLLTHFQTAIFTDNSMALMPFQLPPATDTSTEVAANIALELPLVGADPLAAEQFCLVLTNKCSLVMVLGENLKGVPAFQFSFDPDDVQQGWLTLRARVLLSSPRSITYLDALVKQFTPTIPDYRTVMEFSRLLLKHLPEEAKEKSGDSRWALVSHSKPEIENNQFKDVELLQALAHEIRTPLTAIRTLTQLLLKRRDLVPDITRRLEIIDRECTEQIDRMELIFRAVEVATSEFKQTGVNLTTISLSQLLQQNIPRWQKQAQRRNLTLEVVLPQKLPAVVSNPAMLDQVLTGLIENFTRNLPAGGHIQVEVSPAGAQLKLQLKSQPHADETGTCPTTSSGRKSLGQLLMLQPETGSLSLNMNITKDLFQALGGKLIVRQSPRQGEILTIFLPLEVGSINRTYA